MQRAVDWLIYFAGAADKIQGEQIPFKPDALAYTRREPVGVVGAILPWNSPILLYAWKIGPALAAGNAMVLKPAEQTPVTALEIAKLVEEAGFPAGVFNVVPGLRRGRGRGAGRPSRRQQDVVHRQLRHRAEDHGARRRQSEALHLRMRRQVASHRLRRCRSRDARWSVAVHSAFRSTGQSCSLGSRLFVQRPLYEDFVEKIAERARAYPHRHAARQERPISGRRPRPSSSPRPNSYIALGKEEGARLVAGGSRPTGFDRGYFIEPTVFADVDNRSRLAQEEIFGPVLAVMPFDTRKRSSRLANDVEYGLVAGPMDVRRRRAPIASRAELEAGLVTVNTFRSTHWMLPYGGYKLSGHRPRERAGGAPRTSPSSRPSSSISRPTRRADPFGD